MILKFIKEKIQKHNNYVKFLRKRGCRIGSGCEIYPSADFGSEPYLITIGNHVRVNSGVKFITHDGGVWILREKECWKDADLFATVKIGDNVHIGTNAIIMPGVTIGNNCIVGCGAIVTKNIPDSSVVVGVPARVIETIDAYIEKHKNDFDYTKFLSFEEKRVYLERKYLNNPDKMLCKREIVRMRYL